MKIFKLVLPFSFPFSGVESPNLTVVVSSLLVKERNMSNVIGYEISLS